MSRPADQNSGLVPLRREAHIPVLDGIRGIAILAVMEYHFLLGTGFEKVTNMIPKSFFTLMMGGWCGVDLFFVLSGFLITGILYDAKGSHHYFVNFHMRRTLRIFPLYYGVLAGLFIVLPAATHLPAIGPKIAHATGNFLRLLHGVATKQGWLWLYAANIKMSVVDGGKWSLGPLIHFWSLAVEEQFYLLWPLLVFSFTRSAMLRVCSLCVLGALIFRIAFVWAGYNFITPFMFTPCRLDALAIGGLASLLVRGTGLTAGMLTGIRWGLAFTIPASVAMIFLTPRESNFVATVGYLLLETTFAAALLFSLSANPGSWTERILANPALRLFGKYSYGLYVFHAIFMGFFIEIFPPARYASWTHSIILGICLHLLLSTLVSLAVAVLSWNLFEKHFLKLKRFFPSGRAMPPAQVLEAQVSGRN